MSNIYIQEPPALGKVLLKTTVGDIDIELWTKETPKASRNFIQLCMEGYYNGTIFHRVVPEFIVQGGDPNGDGTGGESIYGAPFKEQPYVKRSLSPMDISNASDTVMLLPFMEHYIKASHEVDYVIMLREHCGGDEFHSRLRFNRRGLVAMANAGKDDNGSQFFFTLAATPELQNKHTIFGKVTGETIYNVLKLADGLIGPEDRPEQPHKITGAEVLINPFTDLLPRVKETKQEEPKKKKKERQGVKNFGLLSFGAEAEEDEGEAMEYRGKPKSTHDLLDDPKLSRKTAAELEEEVNNGKEETDKEAEEKREKTAVAVSNIRDKLSAKKRERSPEADSNKKKKTDDVESDSDSPVEEYYLGKERDEARLKERDRIRNEIKQLKREMKAPKEESKKETEASPEKKIEQDNEMYQQFIEEQEKYKQMKEKIPKKGAARRRRSRFTRTPKRKPWVKNLYENREYPDNYTDSKFLEELKKNLYIEKVTLKQAVFGSFRVVLRICLCVLYAVLFFYMHNGYINTDSVITLSVVMTTLSYFLYVSYEGSDVTRVVKTILMYLVLGYLLSPILHTLTDTVSTDTIYAWFVIMMLIHLTFFDYEVKVALVSKSLSINAAIFASVCLVSRLSTPFDAFVLLTVSVLLFVLSPQLFKVLLNTKLFVVLYFIILLMTLGCLYTVSVTLTCYFVLVVLIFSVYCPIMFVRWQSYKDNIYGPWDEAVINDSDDLDECLLYN